jgi:hypothetical protein
MNHHHGVVTLLVCLGFIFEASGTLAGIPFLVSIGSLLITLAKALE